MLIQKHVLLYQLWSQQICSWTQPSTLIPTFTYPGINNVIAHREVLMVRASLAYSAIILCCLYQYDSEKGYLDAPKVDSPNCNWTVMRELSQVNIYLNTTHCAK